jgi:hypothetical protein
MLFSWGCGNGREQSESADKAAAASPESAERQPIPEPTAQRVTIPDGTVLSVRLLQAIGSRNARPGQGFAAELAAPVVIQGKVIFPKSSQVRGRVVAASESGRLHEPGYLRITLDAMQMPDGRWVDVRTTSVSAEGSSHKRRNITLIGGGAGLGALIGGIFGGGKGAAIGAASGAGAGTAGAYATGKQDVAFPAERKLRFVTIEEVVMNR